MAQVQDPSQRLPQAAAAAVSCRAWKALVHVVRVVAGRGRLIRALATTRERVVPAAVRCLSVIACATPLTMSWMATAAPRQLCWLAWRGRSEKLRSQQQASASRAQRHRNMACVTPPQRLCPTKSGVGQQRGRAAAQQSAVHLAPPSKTALPSGSGTSGTLSAEKLLGITESPRSVAELACCSTHRPGCRQSSPHFCQAPPELLLRQANKHPCTSRPCSWWLGTLVESDA